MLACLLCKIKSKAKYCIIYDLFGRFIPWCDFMLAVFSVELKIFQHYYFFSLQFLNIWNPPVFFLLGIALLMGNQGNRETVWVSLDYHFLIVYSLREAIEDNQTYVALMNRWIQLLSFTGNTDFDQTVNQRMFGFLQKCCIHKALL